MNKCAIAISVGSFLVRCAVNTYHEQGYTADKNHLYDRTSNESGSSKNKNYLYDKTLNKQRKTTPKKYLYYRRSNEDG